uniref:Retrovirus-related Pol polyprotein from transposon TNT 1-94 n=1 Tax=Trichuris muris TaxID=70415 RepID=A0A5S6QG42_TRIMR
MTMANLVPVTSTVIAKLNGLNYATWSFQMKLVLMECDLWSTIEPGEERPAKESVEKLRLHDARQGRALAKICLAIGDEQQQHVRQLCSPKEVWEELQRLYAPKDSKFRMVQLRRRLYTEKLEYHPSMDAYLATMNHLVTELISVGDSVSDGDVAMTILCGLSDDWDNVVSAICNLPATEFTCATVKQRLLAESYRRNDSSSQGTNALAAKATTFARPAIKNFGKADAICYKCSKKGHYARECKSKVDHKRKQKNSPGDGKLQMSHASLYASCGAVSNGFAGAWVIDSGATHHMSPNEEYFTKWKAKSPANTQVQIADGSVLPIANAGTVRAKLTRNKGTVKEFSAKNTLFVPGIRTGILSVPQMVENGQTVVFSRNGCRIFGADDQLVIEAEKSGRLFIVKTLPRRSNVTINNCIAEHNALDLDVWHLRMMHVSKHRILRMVKGKSAIGLNCKPTEPVICNDCLKGKSVRQPFETLHQRDREIVPLALVHCDLMGPLDESSWGGSKYMLCVIDDATRYVWVCFLRSKANVLNKFKIWKTRAERQTGKTLLKVRTDNGLEFCSRNWETFCDAHGIIHQRTMVYTPQQNGIAERMNRTLMDLVRTTLSNTGLPRSAWAELANTAAYVRNRVTNRHNETKTPFELWFGRKPSVRHLRACGCEVLVHIPKPQRNSKLMPRARSGTLVGYALNGKGWRIWMQDTREVVESRDCVFKERVFSMKKQDGPFLSAEEVTAEPPDVEEKPEEESVRQIPSLSEPSSESGVETIHESACAGEDSTEKSDGERVREVSSKSAAELQRTRSHPMVLRHRKKIQPSKEAECASADIPFPASYACEGNGAISYREAINGPEAAKWLEAMEEEMENLREHETWTLEEPPKGTKPIQCKWVLRKKVNATGEVTRYKARLVAKGYAQQKGIDYEDVYSPTSSFDTIRLLVALGVQMGWILEQADVKCAYLYGQLKEEIYMEQPSGFVCTGSEHLCCKLKKSIYGLKQSGRCWNKLLDQRLRSSGFKRNPIDPCVYGITLRSGRAIICVYVDDILTISQNEDVSKAVKELLSANFECKFAGQVSYLLGVEFTHDRDGGLTLSQKAYVERLLKRFNMENAKSVATPMEARPNFQGEQAVSRDVEKLPYRELVGGLLYLSQRTRPDIAFSVGKLSQFCSNYTKQHWDAAKRILRYLKATKHAGVKYRRNSEPLTAFADADWASCNGDRKSISGYIVFLHGSPIAWRSNKQTSIALSTMEAEYIAVSDCTRELTWMKEFIERLDIGQVLSKPISIMCDSQAAIAHANNCTDKSRTKHIAIRYHFVRDKVNDGVVELVYVPSSENIADVLTKPLSRRQHQAHVERMLDFHRMAE